MKKEQNKQLDAIFEGCTFKEGVNFEECEFGEGRIFEECSFGKDPDFKNCSFEDDSIHKQVSDFIPWAKKMLIAMLLIAIGFIIALPTTILSIKHWTTIWENYSCLLDYLTN